MSDVTPSNAQDLSAAKPEPVEVTPDETKADVPTEQSAPEPASVVEEPIAAPEEPVDPSVPEPLTEPVVPEVTPDADGTFVEDEPEDAPHGQEF